MPIFRTKDKQGNISVNFAAGSGLPTFEAGDAINATIDVINGVLVIKTRLPKLLERAVIELPLSKIVDITKCDKNIIEERSNSSVVLDAVASGLAADLLAGGHARRRAVNYTVKNKRTKEVPHQYIHIKYLSDDTEKATQNTVVLEIVGASLGVGKFIKAISDMLPDKPIPQAEKIPDRITL